LLVVKVSMAKVGTGAPNPRSTIVE
jgi:hypothetical protein